RHEDPQKIVAVYYRRVFFDSRPDSSSSGSKVRQGLPADIPASVLSFEMDPVRSPVSPGDRVGNRLSHSRYTQNSAAVRYESAAFDLCSRVEDDHVLPFSRFLHSLDGI